MYGSYSVEGPCTIGVLPPDDLTDLPIELNEMIRGYISTSEDFYMIIDVPQITALFMYKPLLSIVEEYVGPAVFNIQLSMQGNILCSERQVTFITISFGGCFDSYAHLHLRLEVNVQQLAPCNDFRTLPFRNPIECATSNRKNTDRLYHDVTHHKVNDVWQQLTMCMKKKSGKRNGC